MISKDILLTIVNDFIATKESYFLVDVIVSPSNSICVEIDSYNGVDVDTCCELSRYIESKIDREIEDYELEVGSVGLTSPFKIKEQYIKNLNNEVEVLSKDGKKFVGILLSANDNNFDIQIEKKVKLKGKSSKETIIETVNFLYTEVKYTKYNLRFK